MPDVHEVGITIVCLLYVIKLCFEFMSKRSHKSDNGANVERRQADADFKQGLVDRLESQTLTLSKIHDTTESTSGKASRIEKTVNVIEDRIPRS